MQTTSKKLKKSNECLIILLADKSTGKYRFPPPEQQPVCVFLEITKANRLDNLYIGKAIREAVKSLKRPKKKEPILIAVKPIPIEESTRENKSQESS